jgi:hypothetical protein
MGDENERPSIKDLMEQIKPPDMSWADMPGMESEGPPLTAKMVSIVQILQGELMLCDPCLRWLKAKQAELADAKLRALYTEEELTAMREAMEKEDAKKK